MNGAGKIQAEPPWKTPGLMRVGSLMLFAAAAYFMLLAVVPASTAFASGQEVSKGSKMITIKSGKTVVRIQRQPVSMSISVDGRRILKSGSGAAGSPGMPYGAFGFTFRSDPELTPPSLEKGAEPVDESTGLRYIARRVVAVRKRKDSVKVAFATDDPGAGRLRLFVHRPGKRELRLRLYATSSPVGAVTTAFESPRGEAFHGFGARREGTNLRGSDIKSWVLDYRFPDASTGYYAPVPGFISSRGYGVLLDGDRISRWRMASDRSDAWRVSKAGRSMSLRVFTGGKRRAIAAISERTGRHRLPPAWSTGAMLSRTIGVLADGGGRYNERVEADVERLLQGDVPVSSYAFEGWATMPRPRVESIIRQLKRRGIESVLYIRSFVSNDLAGTETPGAYEFAIENGLVAEDAAGEPYLQPSPFPGAEAAVIDFTNPAARQWWKARVKDLLITGARGFMNDFGEQVLPDMRFFDGSNGQTMHNRYPALQAKVTREAINEWRRRNGGEKVFFFQRAGFSGNPGSAAYENAQFPGDETVDWDKYTGLPSIVPDMLNRAVMGAPGITVDIGGYAQFTLENPILPPTGPELFTRWSQAAVFTPFFRVHNSGLDGAKMPWDFDAATLANWKKTAKLHDRARPLTRKLWKRFTRTGIPMTRPMWMVDPVGARGPRGDDQWLLGNNLLAAPVMEEGATGRPVRLPPGCWRFHGKGPKLAGGRTIQVEAGLYVLPWYTRCGTRPLGD